MFRPALLIADCLYSHGIVTFPLVVFVSIEDPQFEAPFINDDNVFLAYDSVECNSADDVQA